MVRAIWWCFAFVVGFVLMMGLIKAGIWTYEAITQEYVVVEGPGWLFGILVGALAFSMWSFRWYDEIEWRWSSSRKSRADIREHGDHNVGE